MLGFGAAFQRGGGPAFRAGHGGHGGPGGHGGHGGPPPWAAFGWQGWQGRQAWPGWHGWPGGPGGSGPGRRGRGDVRLAVLGLLDEQPMHGYQLIREIGERSQGSWRVSPGSVYPTLSQLEDDGLVASRDTDGRRVFSLTDAGREELAERREEYDLLWQQHDGPDHECRRELGGLVFQVGAAAMQVASAGTERQRERAAELLERVRRDLYRLLADDVEDPETARDAGEA